MEGIHGEGRIQPDRPHRRGVQELGGEGREAPLRLDERGGVPGGGQVASRRAPPGRGFFPVERHQRGAVMEETQEAQDKPAVSRKTMEIAVTLLFLVFGLVVCWDSYRLGAKWGSDGPQAGYFPFYIGIIIVFCSAVTLFQALAIKAAQNTTFVMRGQLKMVTLV